MIMKFSTAALLVFSLCGCTSFKTTSLYRFANDTVAPQQTNEKLRGLPVKLKVPSHVGVTIYEQQVLLGISANEEEKRKRAATDARAEAKEAVAQVLKLESELSNLESNNPNLEVAVETAVALVATLKQQNQSDDAVLVKLLDAQNRAAAAKAALNLSNLRIDTLRFDAIPKAQEDRDKKQWIADEASEAASTSQYALISFTPAQFMVDTELLYTDKVFLVDFKRPAGGILDLTEAKMDDEQYFANVQADVTERTLADVGTALDTVRGAIRSTPNVATPTSAITPDGEVADGVDFQKSVVAYQRFDISEPGWEMRLNDFVGRYIGCSNTGYVEIDDSAEYMPPAIPNPAQYNAQSLQTP